MGAAAEPPADRRLRALARAVHPILRDGEVRLSLVGPRGAGKTRLLQSLLAELGRASADLPLLYADGRSAPTACALLGLLVRLGGGSPPATGWSWEQMVEAWRSTPRRAMVVAIDDADRVADVERVLYTLVRQTAGPLALLLAARTRVAPADGAWEVFPVVPEARGPPPPFPLGAPGDAEGGPERGEGDGDALGDAPRLLLDLLARAGKPLTTGHLWQLFQAAAPGAGLRPLTLRRISGLIRELEEGGWVEAPVVSRGQRGRTKRVVLAGGGLRDLPPPLQGGPDSGVFVPASGAGPAGA